MLIKKRTPLITLFLACSNLSAALSQATELDHITANNRHTTIKEVVFASPYSELPYYQVTKALFNSTKNKQESSESYLLKDAKRTLRNKGDLLDEGRGQKLLQANGICFSGQWLIDKESKFSGLYKLGSQADVMARISVSFSGTKQNERRALGMAIKLFPDDLESEPSLNIFTLHSIGGVKTNYMYDLSMDNEPSLGRIPKLRDITTALRLKKQLLKADTDAGSTNPNVTFRTVGHLAEYNESAATKPRWIRFSPYSKTRINKDDFREELRVEHYPNKQLVYIIEVAANSKNNKNKAQWQTIGALMFNESVTSSACDKRLHFAHPLN